jgi:hypothetical protein
MAVRVAPFERESPIPIPQTPSSFSSARTFLLGPLGDQTHRELVYRPLQFQKRSQLFIGRAQ